MKSSRKIRNALACFVAVLGGTLLGGSFLTEKAVGQHVLSDVICVFKNATAQDLRTLHRQYRDSCDDVAMQINQNFTFGQGYAVGVIRPLDPETLGLTGPDDGHTNQTALFPNCVTRLCTDPFCLFTEAVPAEPGDIACLGEGMERPDGHIINLTSK